MTSAWLQHLREFFDTETTKAGLKILASAEGCREGWLQGQAYLHFRSKGIDLRTNSLPIQNEAAYQKADFFVPGEGGLLAECKVLGTVGYAYKMLDGLGIRGPQSRLATQGNLRYDYSTLATMDEPGEGLLRDFFRLALCTREELLPSTARILILVLSKYEQPDSLGELLLKVQFGALEDASEDLVDEDDLLVRAWQIKPQVLTQ